MKTIDIFKGLNLMVIPLWLIVLRKTDAFYSGYLLVGVLGIILLWIGKKNVPEMSRRLNRILVGILSILFSFATALANYTIIRNGMQWCVMLYAGYVAAENAIYALYYAFSKADLKRLKENNGQHTYAYIYGLSFILIAAIDIAYLVFLNYPGSISSDSLWQIEQILSGGYNNHHPYWHTRFMGMFVKLGKGVLGSINAGVALYVMVQIILMASCFAFAIMTLYQAGIKTRYLMFPLILYAAMPYHVAYSNTLWKDVLFGGVSLLMIISLYRVFSDIGRKHMNYVLLCVGFMGVALFRNNGWLALLGSFVLLFFCLRKKRLHVAAMMAVVLIVSWVLKNPVLSKLGVPESSFVESLSIPIQQIARVIAFDGEITDDQKEKLRMVVDIDQVPQWYNPHLSDPVKFKVNGEYIREHKQEYFKLWADIGARNIDTYIQSWIEQTKGYWNAGYRYWIWCAGSIENDVGIQGKPYQLISFQNNRWLKVFEPLFSIGMHTWGFLILLAFNWMRGEKEKAYLAIPVLMIIGTLLIATPVYCEFRYAYVLFTVLPTYLLLSIHKERAGTD